MDSTELVSIAKTFTDALLTQGLSKAELAMTASLINTMVSIRLEQVPSVVLEALGEASPPSSPPAPRVVKKKKTGIKYDAYDPPPPFSVDPLPEPVAATGKVIGKKDSACVCASCNAGCYIINKDIPDNCPVSDFTASFTPITGTPPMPETLEIQNVDGNISIDCPKCGANKMLYLVGKAVQSYQ